jgi:hypothetical protein
MSFEQNLAQIGITLDPDLEPVTPWNSRRIEEARKTITRAREKAGSGQARVNWPLHDALDEFEQALYEVERLQVIAVELPDIYRRIRDVEGTMRLIARVNPTPTTRSVEEENQ